LEDLRERRREEKRLGFVEFLRAGSHLLAASDDALARRAATAGAAAQREGLPFPSGESYVEFRLRLINAIGTAAFAVELLTVNDQLRTDVATCQGMATSFDVWNPREKQAFDEALVKVRIAMARELAGLTYDRSAGGSGRP
jgi:hypothetical protein